MATGGRVLHHLAHRIGDSRNCIILVGFQAEGTRGRDLVSGARQIKLLGRYVPVGAEIVDIPGFSIHADADELVTWLGGAGSRPSMTYVIHGEESASSALRDRIDKTLEWDAVVPSIGERVRLD
jgi:metallo-beta-lactamase family protein